jgi:peptide methionine sulfoxide reductase MsrA
VPGVIETDVGYTGGWLENPTYDDTHDSKSGHAEAIRVTFDPSIISYEDLLEKWFFKLHDPRRSIARVTTWGPSTLGDLPAEL